MNLTLWPDFINVANELTESERGQLLLAILEFLNGKDENELTGAVRIAYVSLRTQAIRDNKGKKEYSEEQSRKGKLGGRPKKETDTVSEKPSKNEKAEKAAAFSAKTEKPSKSKKPKVEIETEDEIETEEPPKSPTGDSDARFAEFWQAYPRKVGKAAAEKSWKRLHLTAELFAKIMAAVETAKHTEQWQEQNGRFIPNPATWLNQGRWDDEYADNGTSDFDPDDPYAAWGEGG